MFLERKINQTTGAIELWECDWVYPPGEPAKKIPQRMIGEEQPLKPLSEHGTAEAICWAYGRTLGNIAVFSQAVIGSFTAENGEDAKLACDFVHAGKFRHGAERWWCRTHQTHWGTKADLEAAQRSGVMVCSNHAQVMNYVLNPQQIKLDEYAEVGIWCSLPAALASHGEVPMRPPRIHVHVRPEPGGMKTIDADFNAISLHYSQDLGLFNNSEITKVNVTPPAALEFLRAMVEERPMDLVNCSHCGYPHLDLGNFAVTPHRKHFCGNCGRDSTWSKEAIVSTPLKPLHDQLNTNANTVMSERVLNLDDYADSRFVVWASTPAILWTADRPQELGIHVHLAQGGKRIIDETFGRVIYKGVELKREELLQTMIERTVV